METKSHTKLMIRTTIGVFLVCICGFFLTTIINSTSTGSQVHVNKVIDGDTFETDTGQRVRMIGIDTPELHHPKKPVQCFAKEAYKKTKELIEGKLVRLEKDISQTDRYGRLLRFVYLLNADHQSKNELFVNAYLVKEGYAHAYTFPPDVSKSEEFQQFERQAMYNDKGLWKSCK